MEPDHPLWRERVLAYEDLEPDERAEIDAHLATCASCRELRRALLERETAARPEGALELEGAALAPDDETAAAASLERLVAKLRPPSRAPLPLDAARRRRRTLTWLVPAVAAAAAAFVAVFVHELRQPGTPAPLLHDLSVAPASGPRGSRPAAFRVGDAFVLRFQLARPGIPLVVVVDEAGTTLLLHPTDRRSARVLPAGPVVLPDSASGELWTFSGAPGTDTFLAAGVAERQLDLPRLQAELARIDALPGPRTARADSARAILARHAGPVQVIEVPYGP